MGKGCLFADRSDVVLRGFEDPVRLHEVRSQDQSPRPTRGGVMKRLLFFAALVVGTTVAVRRVFAAGGLQASRFDLRRCR
jgi:hypothetical protein